jgi:protein O-GlcNAc transferase
MAEDLADVALWLERALALHREGRLEEAASLYLEALAVRPDHAGALHLIGVVKGQQGHLREALEDITRAAALAPGAAPVFCNLSKFLFDAGRAEEASAAARTAIGLRADYAEAHSNLAAALNLLARHDEAAAAAAEAVRLSPELAQGYHNLGNARRALGRVDLAVAAYRTALRIRPGSAAIQHDFLNAIRYDPAFDSDAVLRETRRWYDEQAATLAYASRRHLNDRSPERQLRVGYVSPDFRDHPVGYNLLPLYRAHSPDAVQVFSYAGVREPDALTAEFRSRSDAWRNTIGLSHDQLARLVREDGIDILVDLSLHTANNRLFTFALKPAPVQVAFAGYPGTTGMRVMHYRLTDPFLDPPGDADSVYIETSVRLPSTFWCIDPLADDIPVSPSPAGDSGPVTFGCLGDFMKTNDAVLSLWGRVLRAVSDSRLLLGCPVGSARRRVLDRLAEDGVGPERVVFCGRRPRREYLETYQSIDIALDTVPYNGHTTSLDAFWMGVPVVTLIGPTVVGRAGLSQAMNLGLPELVARTPSEFVAAARRLALDRTRAAELRRSLRERMRASPLMNGRAFAAGVEAAYREMWRRWCAKESNA